VIKRENEMLKNTDLFRLFEMCNSQLAQKDTIIAQKDGTIAEKDGTIAEKDVEIKRLTNLVVKKKTINNTTNNNTNYITVVFGRESTDHITDTMYKQLLRAPKSSIHKFMHLKHFSSEAPPQNNNVRLPNVRGNTVEVCRQGQSGPEFMHEDKSQFVRSWVEENKEELREKAENMNHSGWIDCMSRFGDAEMRYCVTSAESVLKNNRKRKTV